MRRTLLLAALLAGLASSLASAEPLSFDFTAEDALKAWHLTQPDRWQITDTEGEQGRALHLLGVSKAYQPPHRSPHSIALLKGKVLGSFTLTAKVKTLQNSRGHRDMCIFWGWQDPAHFYYVHLGEKPDPNSSQIFIVKDAPRTPITTKNAGGIPWKDDTWHDVKLVRDVEKGTIEVFFDDMETPCKVAEDKTFAWGMIGLGSFDDLGMWDDVRIDGKPVEGKEPKLPKPAGKTGSVASPRPQGGKASPRPQVGAAATATGGVFLKATADEAQDGNPAAHAIDTDPETRWAVEGKGHHLDVELAKPGTVDRVGLGFRSGKRIYSFAIQTSSDGKTWSEPIAFKSPGNGDAVTAYELPAREARFLRVVSEGNSENRWMNLHTLTLGEIPKAPISADTVFQVTEWARDPLLQNGVAISLDDQGRAYVTTTIRRKVASLDIRQHRDWVKDDLSFTDIEERRAYYKRRFNNDPASGWLPDDKDGDGKRDWQDLCHLRDAVVRVDGGKAERVDEFHTEVTGIAAGVLAVGEDVWVAAEPDILRYRGGLTEGRTVVSTGYSLHIGQGGHNLSGLAVGPDGRVYWSVADKGHHIVTAEGREFHAPNSGGVFRSELDGSNVERYSQGERNAQELAFDPHGNLFSMDNDGDYKGEMERALYITEGSMHGWRLNWQWLGMQDFTRISGIAAYNPWMEEKLFLPAGKNTAAYLTPTIGNFGPGPCGFAANPGTALSPDLGDAFFLTHNGGDVRTFRFLPDGAAFRFEEGTKIKGGLNNTGLAFGPDGALYASSYGKTGTIHRFDVPGDLAHPLRAETAALLAAKAADTSIKDLQEWLAHADQRVRMKAQFELVRRGEEGLGVLAATLGNSTEQLARLHAIWGIGMVARQGDPDALKALAPAWKDSDPEILAQAAKVTGDLRDRTDLYKNELLGALGHEHPRPVFFAAIALGNRRVGEAVAPLLKLAETDDPYLRHAAVMGLAGCASDEELAKMTTGSPAQRLTAVVALRRQRSPAVSAFLDDSDETVVLEAARAIYDDASIPAALPDLAGVLSRTDLENPALLRRAIGAAFRSGTTRDLELLAGFVQSGHPDSNLRRTALASILWWAKPPVLDPVEGRYRKHEPRDPEPMHAIVAKLRETIAADPHLAEVLLNGAIEHSHVQWLAGIEVDPATAPADLQVRYLRAAGKVGLPNGAALVRTALESKHASVREEAREQAEGAGIPVVDILLSVLDAPGSEGKAQAVRKLAALKDPRAQERFTKLCEAYRAKNLALALRLDLWEAAAARGIELPATADRFEEGGDPKRGEKLVSTHNAAQCIRCHQYGKNKVAVSLGPPIKGIGKGKSREHLVAALLEPSRDLSPGYGNLIGTLRDGTPIAGVVKKQTDKAWTIDLPDGGQRTLDPAELKEHQLVSLMPPMLGILKPAEIRDIVAFLVGQ